MAERIVLFVCVENAGRSLMAEAIFNARAPPGWHAVSAGTLPAAKVNPRTAPMLREIGLDLPSHPPQKLEDRQIAQAQLRVTMGCLDSESCPIQLKKSTYRDWELPDPARLDDAGFRRVRDEIEARVGALLGEISSPRENDTTPPERAIRRIPSPGP